MLHKIYRKNISLVILAYVPMSSLVWSRWCVPDLGSRSLSYARAFLRIHSGGWHWPWKNHPGHIPHYFNNKTHLSTHCLSVLQVSLLPDQVRGNTNHMSHCSPQHMARRSHSTDIPQLILLNLLQWHWVWPLCSECAEQFRHFCHYVRRHWVLIQHWPQLHLPISLVPSRYVQGAVN